MVAVSVLHPASAAAGAPRRNSLRSTHLKIRNALAKRYQNLAEMLGCFTRPVSFDQAPFVLIIEGDLINGYQDDEDAAGCIGPGVGDGAPGVARERKGAHACQRRVSSRAQAHAVGRGDSRVCFRWPRGQGYVARSLRGTQTINRV